MSAAATLGYGQNCPLRPARAIVREGPPPSAVRPARGDAGGPRLLDQVRSVIRFKHYSRRTERACAGWIRRFILFHGRLHPAELGEAEVSRFLSHLAVEAKVSASAQNQALSALHFLHGEVLKQELGWLDGIVRAKRPARLPVV